MSAGSTDLPHILYIDDPGFHIRKTCTLTARAGTVLGLKQETWEMRIRAASNYAQPYERISEIYGNDLRGKMKYINPGSPPIEYPESSMSTHETFSTMVYVTKIPWLMPAVMGRMGLLGVNLGLDHDRCYNSLVAAWPPTRCIRSDCREFSRSRRNSRQGVPHLGGVLSLSQTGWRETWSDEQAITSEDMGVFISALGNGLSLANFATWWKWLLLLLIAITAW